LVIIAAVGLGAWTLWMSAVPVWEFLMFGAAALLWPITGVVWAITAVRASTNDTTRFLFLFAPVLLVVLGGPWPVLLGLVSAVGTFALALALERRPRIVWLVAPAIVVATIALAVSGLPAKARFAAAEPGLTTFAHRVL
jgi:hypothetical protein